MPWLKPADIRRWSEGNAVKAYEKLGCHVNSRGAWFAVWAPHADSISVIGDFNEWNPDTDHLQKVDVATGLWEVYIRGVKPGQHYKYRIRKSGSFVDKSDPFAFAMEGPAPGGHPVHGLSAVVTDLEFEWSDQQWMQERKGPGGLKQPVAAYEVHLGSWRRHVNGYSYSYREIAEPLADHVLNLGFTHVEFLPVMEHPYYGSWGYQVVGYFAPTSRYGTPADFMYLVNYLHERGIGVLLDWVPAHFATDPQGLVYFDGSPLYEYEDPGMRHHPDWGTYVFDYGKPGVENFLISNAIYWLDKFHIDGLRVDAVASMLYRDYSRDHWTPNIYGGRENLEAIQILRRTNAEVYRHYPEAMMVAEESTAWPGVTRPTFADGLGFLYKWNMGWMHDTLHFMKEDPINRQYHHDSLTFPLIYAFSEQYVLPLSHDEVVHGKGSLWGKMPGDGWQKAANLRLLYAHMVGHPGKLLLFMGSEFGQPEEWNADWELNWRLLQYREHNGIMDWLRDLLHLYRSRSPLWSDQPDSFEWVSHEDRSSSVITYRRHDENADLLFAFNLTPVPRPDYPIGVPGKGRWKCVLNSDEQQYGGTGNFLTSGVSATRNPANGRDWSIKVALPPLGAIVLERQ